MFSWFKRKRNPLDLKPELKQWIDAVFLDYVAMYGYAFPDWKPFVLPDEPFLRGANLQESEADFQRVFCEVCRRLDQDPGDLHVSVIHDAAGLQYDLWQVTPTAIVKIDNPAEPAIDVFKCVKLPKTALADVGIAVWLIGSELLRIRMYSREGRRNYDRESELNIDLGLIHLGFGIFVVNGLAMPALEGRTRHIILSEEVTLYTCALQCYSYQIDPAKVAVYMPAARAQKLHTYCKYLTDTQDTQVNATTIDAALQRNAIFEKMRGVSRTRDFEGMIAGAQQWLALGLEKAFAENNWGYALLLKKQYREAIPHFTVAIENPSNSDGYAYNNRGYCHLQLGEMQAAHRDIQQALQINKYNSFAWRNLGAYYLKLGHPKEALRHFLEAQSIDPTTEMIHFYLASAYFALQQVDQGLDHRAQSLAHGEYNDSVMADL